MKVLSPAVFSTGIARALTWVVVIWLEFGPIYQSTSVVPVGPGETLNELTRTNASLIEVNGWQVLPILPVPAALTGLALLTVLFTPYRTS